MTFVLRLFALSLLVTKSVSHLTTICVWNSIDDWDELNGEYTLQNGTFNYRDYWKQSPTPSPSPTISCPETPFYLYAAYHENAYWWVMNPTLYTEYAYYWPSCETQPIPDDPTQCNTNDWQLWGYYAYYFLPLTVTDGSCPSLECDRIKVSNTGDTNCDHTFIADGIHPNAFVYSNIYFFFNVRTFKWFCSDNADMVTDCDGYIGSDNKFLSGSGWTDINGYNGDTITLLLGNGYTALLECIMPTINPTASPTPSPTALPTKQPTVPPTLSPTPSPTTLPTNHPTVSPTSSPTLSPTAPPTNHPTTSPTSNPTSSPTLPPTSSPTINPTSSTANPTIHPTEPPTKTPTTEPTTHPTTPSPTVPAPLTCGDNDTGSYNGEYLPFMVHMPYYGDLKFDTNGSEFQITMIETFKVIATSTQILQMDEDGVTALFNVESGDYQFVIDGGTAKNLVYNVRIICTDKTPTRAPTHDPTQEPTVHPTSFPTQRPTIPYSIFNTSQPRRSLWSLWPSTTWAFVLTCVILAVIVIVLLLVLLKYRQKVVAVDLIPEPNQTREMTQEVIQTGHLIVPRYIQEMHIQRSHSISDSCIARGINALNIEDVRSESALSVSQKMTDEGNMDDILEMNRMVSLGNVLHDEFVVDADDDHTVHVGEMQDDVNTIQLQSVNKATSVDDPIVYGQNRDEFDVDFIEFEGNYGE